MPSGFTARFRRFLTGASPEAPPGHTPVRVRPGFDFTLTGLVYSLMLGFMGLAAINGQANLLFGVFGLMIGILLISGMICRTVIRRLSVTRLLPDSAVVGRPATILYEFHNHKRFWPSLSVNLAELDGVDSFHAQPAAYMLHAAARMTATVPTEVLPRRRGLCRLNHYQISTSFPFGFIRRALTLGQTDSMIVYPAVGKVSERLLTMCRSAEKVGAPMKPQRGGEDEFYGVREYRSGESLKSIYWRRSAKAPGLLVAREMTQVAPPRLLLMVDTHAPQRTRADAAEIERVIAMAGSLAAHTLEMDMAVGACAWTGGDPEFTVLGVQRGKRQRRDILSMLACLPRNTLCDADRLLEFSRRLINRGITGILFTRRSMHMGLADEARGSLLVISASSRLADAWFTFDSTVDFSHSMPLDQAPGDADV